MAKKRKIPKRRRGKNRSPKLNPLGLDVPIIHSINALRDDTEGLDEMAGYEAALKMHPDMYQMIIDGKPLPEEAEDETGNVWRPNLHLSMHATLENQLGIDEPAGIAAIALKLEAEKLLGAHEVRHAIIDALVGQIFELQKNQTPFDHDRYLKDIPDHYQIFVDAKR